MITPMKKLTLLCLARDQHKTLTELRDLGVVHLVHVEEPDGADLDAARHKLSRAEKALDTIRRAAKEAAPGQTLGVPAAGSPVDLVATIEQMTDHRATLVEEQHGLLQEKARIEPFGDFDPSQLNDLHHHGLTLRLCRSAEKDPIDLPAGATSFLINQDGETAYSLVVSQSPIRSSGHDIAPTTQSLSATLSRIDAISLELTTIDSTFAGHGSAPAALVTHVATLSEEVAFLEARSGMGSAERIAYLQGYCPAERAASIESAAGEHGWGTLIEETSADEMVPTLLKSPKWVQPIKAVFDVIKILPGYREQDISMVFLIFFSIFFAMLIGDAGYGLLFLAGTWFARFRMKKAPSYPFTMLTVLSIGTVIWGTLTGNYFGMPTQHAPFSGLQIDWLTDQKHIMALCFLIGAVHMTIAHVWRMLTLIGSKKALEQVGWICVVWSMFFIARQLVAEVEAPGFTMIMLGVGIALIALFMATLKELKTEWINLAMLPLSIVSALVDVISYIRLFAVGMASLAVAQSFNEMALGIGFSNVFAGFCAALILFFGHLLNIILCGLAVLVHGVRLNTLEFSMHMNMEWSGVPYTPFARTHTQRTE